MLSMTSDAVGMYLDGDGIRLRIQMITPSIARMTYTKEAEFSTKISKIVENTDVFSDYIIQEGGSSFMIRTSRMTICVDKNNAAVHYFDRDGIRINSEPKEGGKFLTPITVTKKVYDASTAVEASENIDGPRAVSMQYETVFDRNAYSAKLCFQFDETEAIFGLGSHEEGYGNLRGKSRHLYQQNLKAVVPAFYSTKGYGYLFDCGSLMTFHDDAQGSYVWMDTVNELDYYFIFGGDYDGYVKGYRHLTGKAPMLPKWAFGYAQSKERYEDAEELQQVVAEYRRREVPLDLIVLDWKSWPIDGGWGQKTFDEKRFANPGEMTENLHKMGAKMMVSIWPIMTGGCENQKEMLEKGYMLGNQCTYNAFSPAARECYWRQAEEGLFSKGIDGWWCDCTEPFEKDWNGSVKKEPFQRLWMNTMAAKDYLDWAEINLYSLEHSKGIYEHQRGVSDKRVVNLTRSSYAGQHRYATITWSGDTSASWQTLQRSIPEGINFCATGEPYWTVDIGGFFVKSKDVWFYKGEYEKGCEDKGYAELYTRWLQYGAFLPMMRSHGTDTPREIWRFGEKGTMFYDAIEKFIRLRYRFMPYIYSLASKVTLEDGSMIRGLAMEFPQDATACSVKDAYMFGHELLICPVVTPMYYAHNSEQLHNVPKCREVYLPKGTLWYDFWSGNSYQGGQTILANAPIDIMPIFVRAGSILPATEVMQYTAQKPEAPYEILIFGGENADFTIYEDEGDGYEYESGAYVAVELHWQQDEHLLTIGARKGYYPGMIREREYRIRFSDQNGIVEKTVTYTGERIRVEVI